jgi:PilZ domain-containing protein
MTTPVLRESAVRKAGIQHPVAGFSPDSQGYTDTRKQCAYNQTRERFLGLDIDAGDFAVASLDDRMPALTPKSGAGLWLVPFKGVSPTSVHIPLDLAYLDRNCRVIDIVESFPIYQVSPSSPSASSVLVLPARMIASTETQVGDQLLLCAPEEMKWQLQKLSGSSGAAGQNAASAREEPGRSGSPNLLQWEDRSRQQRPNENHSQAEQPNGIGLVEPGTRDIKPAKSWWQRLLSPDPPQPRKTSRETLRGLTAYFWTGGVPVAHDIQDVSPTGLYVVTEERWYPGTVIRMTLTDSTEPTAERSITVNATAMRWGNDGVGLQFVLQDSKNPRQSQTPGVEGVDKKQLDLFMQRLRNGRG